MKLFRHKHIRRFFSLALALMVFNLSIDPPDLLENLDDDLELEENLAINEMESIAEFIMEKGLDMENAMPETDDPDSDNFVKKAEVFFSVEQKVVLSAPAPVQPCLKHSRYRYPAFHNPLRKHFSPPPEA